MDKKLQICIILGVMCFLLTIGICIQIKTVDNTSTRVGSTMEENSLRDSVLKWKENYDEASKEYEELEKRLEILRTSVTENDEGAKELKEEILLNNKLLGLTKLVGRGISIVVADADPSVAVGLDKSAYCVLDEDLLTIINDLKNAGAEAISINSQRIVNTTEISCAGNIIKINGEKVGSPYKINAIGFPEKLKGALAMPGGYIDWMKDDGIQVTITTEEKIEIPKYEGVYKSDYMKTVE